MTRRWIGFTPMTDMAESSSRMLREPMSDDMAEPPAPEISSAVATGATSRTMARTTADPVADWAPSWRASWPTCREMVAPSGMAISRTGRVVTRARNQHCSSHSRHQDRTSQVRRNPSAAKATMPPVWSSACPAVRTAAVVGAVPTPVLTGSAAPYDDGHTVTKGQSSGRSGAQGAPLMWLPPSTKRVLPVR